MQPAADILLIVLPTKAAAMPGAVGHHRLKRRASKDFDAAVALTDVHRMAEVVDACLNPEDAIPLARATNRDTWLCNQHLELLRITGERIDVGARNVPLKARWRRPVAHTTKRTVRSRIGGRWHCALSHICPPATRRDHVTIHTLMRCTDDRAISAARSVPKGTPSSTARVHGRR